MTDRNYAAEEGARQSPKPAPPAGDRSGGAAFPEKNNPDGRVSSMIMQFAQFLAYDIADTDFPEKHCCLNPNRPECFNIEVGVSDSTFTQKLLDDDIRPHV